MIIRSLKTAAVGVLAYHAARRVAAERKLAHVRQEAQAEIDRLEDVLRAMHAEKNQFDLTDQVTKDKFDDTVKQLSKWTRIWARTF